MTLASAATDGDTRRSVASSCRWLSSVMLTMIARLRRCAVAIPMTRGVGERRLGRLEIQKRRAYRCQMLLLRRLLVALTTVAFVGGMTIQITPSAAALG